MSLEQGFADSFERYKLGSTTDPQVLGGLAAYWTSIAFSNCQVVTGISPNGKCIALGAGVDMFKTLPAKSGWTIAWRYQINPSTTGNLLNTMYENRGIASTVISVGTSEDGDVVVTIGSTPIAITAPARHFSKFYHYELNFDLSKSDTDTYIVARHAKITLDGEEIEINPDADTDSGVAIPAAYATNAITNVHAIRSSFSTNYLDDFVIYDHTGDHNNDTIGDVKIIGIVPNGDTAVKDFTPSTGTVHYSLINIIPPLGDPSSLFDPTPGDMDIWDWQDIPTFTGTIQGVLISIYARKDDEGSRTFKINCGATGSDAQSPEFFLNDNYVYHHWGLDQDPVTSADWTVISFNARQFGVQVES